MNREALTPGLLAALPIFPLPDCVLLPGGLLPLHVFEPRYREMTRDCLAGDRVMAIARLRPGYEDDYHGRPPVHPFIGVGQVIQSQEQTDGRFLLVLGGIARAEIMEELAPRRAYREVRARLLVDGGADPARMRAGHDQLTALCDALAQRLDGGAALRDLVRSGPPSESADAVAAAITRDPDDRQRLLECVSPETRLDVTIELASALLSAVAPGRN